MARPKRNQVTDDKQRASIFEQASQRWFAQRNPCPYCGTMRANRGLIHGGTAGGISFICDCLSRVRLFWDERNSRFDYHPKEDFRGVVIQDHTGLLTYALSGGSLLISNGDGAWDDFGRGGFARKMKASFVQVLRRAGVRGRVIQEFGWSKPAAKSPRSSAPAPA